MTDLFEDAALFEFSGYRVGQGASAEGVVALDVTPSFFQVLGSHAAAGRLFREDDGHVRARTGSSCSAMRCASKQPGGVAGIIGNQLRLNDELYDVIGVLPDRFAFLNPEVRLFTPLAFRDEDRGEDRRFSQNHDLVARLARGVTLEQAQARVDAMNLQIIERAGAIKGLLVNAGYTTRMVGLQADLVRDVRGALMLLWGGVLFVVLIAAVNIANLSLVRTSARMKELATRSAIGAGRGRIARQLVTEALLLTLIGGALGLFVGFWSLSTLGWIGLSDLPRAHEIGLDRSVFGLTFGLALLLGLAVGLAPSIHLARASLSDMLREEGRSGTSGRATRHMRRGLVVSQVALAFVLLVGAGLLLASFQRLLRVDPGFTASGVITARLSPLHTRYRDNAALRTYVNLVLERIRVLPGVEAAGVTSYLPFSTDSSSNVIVPEGRAMSPGESVVSPNTVYVTPGYWRR